MMPQSATNKFDSPTRDPKWNGTQSELLIIFVGAKMGERESG